MPQTVHAFFPEHVTHKRLCLEHTTIAADGGKGDTAEGARVNHRNMTLHRPARAWPGPGVTAQLFSRVPLKGKRLPPWNPLLKPSNHALFTVYPVREFIS